MPCTLVPAPVPVCLPALASVPVLAPGASAAPGAPLPGAPGAAPSARTTLYEVLYVSQLAPGTPVTAVARIASHARKANAERGLTGLLVFDGQRFCQQLEGTQKNVLSAMARICQDPRHVELNVVHQGTLAARRFSGFALAFSAVDQGDLLEQLERLDGAAALQAFEALCACVLL